MKTLKNFAVVVCVSVLTFYGCKDETKAAVTATPTTTETAQETTPTDTNTNTDTDTKVIAENTGTVYHYTCSRGCAGGSATAGTCSTCGNTLAHNQAFHANNTNQDNSNVAPLFGDPSKTSSSATTTTTSTGGQNAAGVWHYICQNGCAGGAAAAGTCGNCSATLAHNQAYHN